MAGRMPRNWKHLRIIIDVNTPIAPNKKRRVTEIDVLSSGGSGDRMRTGSSHDQPTPYAADYLKARVACPDVSYNKDIHFNQVAFDNYTKLVLQYTEISRTTMLLLMWQMMRGCYIQMKNILLQR